MVKNHKKHPISLGCFFVANLCIMWYYKGVQVLIILVNGSGMLMKISKRVFLMVMALVMALSVTNTFALTNLKVTDNGNGTVTITAEDAEKIAVTQYDRLGFIKTMGISNLVCLCLDGISCNSLPKSSCLYGIVWMG